MKKLSLQPTSSSAGFSLVETLVAIGIMTSVISGIMALVYQGSVASRFQTNQITATYLAADAIEHIRSLRDSHWLEDPGANRFEDWAIGITGSCGGTCSVDSGVQLVDGFSRSVQIDLVSINGSYSEVEITSTVTWERNNRTEEVEIKQSIFDYRNSNDF